MSRKLKKVHDELHELGPNIRIERGPPLRVGKAAEELLSDANTATHYHLPKRFKSDDGQVMEKVATDALGKPIRKGEIITYLDWNRPRDEQGWYLYRRETKEPRMIVADHDENGFPKRGKDHEIITKPDPNDWREVGYFETYEEAMAEAEKLPD
jgi:hypothetical protein